MFTGCKQCCAFVLGGADLHSSAWVHGDRYQVSILACYHVSMLAHYLLERKFQVGDCVDRDGYWQH